YYTTLAGEFQNSDSPYGTFDKGGNVWEWNEAILYGAYCGLRGGSFLSHSIDTLHASYRYGNIPTGQISYIGFRVCEALEQIMGDLDHDGDVDIFDWAIFQPNYGTMSDMSYDDGDLDGDADVDMFDWALFQPMYGIGTDGEPVPEPLTLSLLALGCLRLSTVNVTPDRRCWHQPDLWYRSRGVLACGCRQGSFRGSPRYHRPFRPVLSVARRWVDPRRLRQGFLADFQRHHRNLP
ncbi:MAG: hypothetical protein HQ546_10955, partial [Planctomycetes bacterium]|nr:hypothetical protein [Planctomycetota bacterium]